MRKGLFVFTFLLIVQACKIDREGTIDRSRFTFRVTPDALLFFRNVRQIYYDFTDLEEARWHVFRYGERYEGNDYPIIHPTIVIDWMKEESYVLVEVNDLLTYLHALVVKERDHRSGTIYSYQLGQRGKENMLEFATKIYEAIMKDNELFIIIDDQAKPLLDHEDDRENFRIAMSDYFRLTRIIR